MYVHSNISKLHVKNIHLVLIQMTNGVIIYDTLLKLLPFRFNNYLILPIFTLPLRNIFSVLIIKSPLHLSQFFARIFYSAVRIPFCSARLLCKLLQNPQKHYKISLLLTFFGKINP